jgi:hypothetical protein
LSPQSADWVRAHPEFVTDPRLNRKMIAAHELAMADGLDADTPEYFAAVEATLGVAERGNGRAAQEAASEASAAAAKKAGGRSAAPPAAPVSREAPSAGSGRKPNAVRLTREEVDMAEMMGMTPQEYAKHKIALQSEGKMSTH